MGMAQARRVLVVAPAGQPPILDGVEWLRSEMLKTHVAHGYCARELVAEACPYAIICEQCKNEQCACGARMVELLALSVGIHGC